MSAEIIQFPMRGAASGSRLHDEHKRGMRAYAQMISECCEEEWRLDRKRQEADEEKPDCEQFIEALKDKLGLQMLRTRGAPRDKDQITRRSYRQVRDAVSVLVAPYLGHMRAEQAVYRLVRQRFGCRVTELRERDVSAVMELLAEVERATTSLLRSQSALA